MRPSLFEKFFEGRSEHRTMELSLGRIDNALSALRPLIAGKVIHIAGTNGKGSTSFYIANILRTEGFNVMLFTSPHVISIYERIQYNGEFIAAEDFDAIFSCYKNIITENSLTYFETLFFIFMISAGEKRPDFLVLETGLGGRYDATNTSYIKEKYPVITHIAADHREILGRNIYKILDEKAAVIKGNSPVFAGVCKDFIIQELRLISPLVIIPSDEDVACALEYAPPPFNGNLALAITVAEYVCGKKIPYRCYPLPPCRQERFGRIILDGAHNESGILELKKRFPSIGGVLLSSTKERNINNFIRFLSKCTGNMIITAIPGNPRSITSAALNEANGLTFTEDPLIGLKELEKQTDGDILVTGSLYLCSYVRTFLTR
ncbi:MAG: hypothetical protein LBD73_08285 [Deferribacteraceae bacterium]|jgi:dihydrofolate synthase/folylpolyglutamate synthase|nr:hypothetical protein [Deferribacteraceae bacterium]